MANNGLERGCGTYETTPYTLGIKLKFFQAKKIAKTLLNRVNLILYKSYFVISRDLRNNTVFQRVSNLTVFFPLK